MTLWALKRDLFLGGCRYRQQDGGTEVPDHLVEADGTIKKIVPANKDRKYAADEVPMPRDAELYDATKTYAGRADRRLLGKKTTGPEPVALSQLPKHGDAAGAVDSAAETAAKKK